MARFVWAIRGTSRDDMEAAKAVIVHAEGYEDARDKILRDQLRCMGLEPGNSDYEDAEQSLMDSFGDEWILNSLNEEDDIR